jgi:predicted PolB exonuclease-like 3'-5' exonuclease
MQLTSLGPRAEHVLVWDLETVPDLEAVARVEGTEAIADVQARTTLKDGFPKLPFHKIVCIGALLAEKQNGVWWVRALGAPHIGERSERELIAAFVEKIATLRPQLVTFNGSSFDLPVLRYRGMMHRVYAPGLRARPYFKRYLADAVDLCDVLASFDARGKMTLHELCRALNLPGKPDQMDGSKVEAYVHEGRLAEVANYCECDVVSTFRLWLLHELFKGTISHDQYSRSEAALASFINSRLVSKPHWARLIEAPPYAVEETATIAILT